MLVDLPTSLATLLFLSSSAVAFPVQPWRRAAPSSASIPWATTSPTFFVPGDSTPKAASRTAQPLTTPAANPKFLEKRQAEPTVPLSVYTSVQDIAESLLSDYFATASIPTSASSSASAASPTTTPASTSRLPATTTSASSSSASASPSSNPGLGDGALFWNLKSSFSNLASFVGAAKLTSYAWGKDNVAVVQGIPKNEWAENADMTNNASALKVTYVKGSYSPGNLPIGGVGFYANPLDVSAATNLSFAYSVFFPDGFDFVNGGKLPGLYGGSRACSGGSSAENCFSTRIMWRKGGEGELYLYAPREKQVNALCNLEPLSFCNSMYGMSIGRGSWTFRTGQWTNVRQDVWLNTPGVANGGFNIWINDKLVLSSDRVYLRNSPVGNIATGGAGEAIPLIDYDSLPSSVVIPNGGFRSSPSSTPSSGSGGSTFDPTFVTKIVGGSAAATATANPNAPDWQNRKMKRAVVDLAMPTLAPSSPSSSEASTSYQSFFDDEEEGESILEKRASSQLPIGFGGMMFQTFFGGSNAKVFSTKTAQHNYFNQIKLRIRSTN